MKYLNFSAGLLVIALIGISGIFLAIPADIAIAENLSLEPIVQTKKVFDVPFYSQFKDIRSPKWQKLGCGIASLAMLIEFYRPGIVSVNTLLDQGLTAKAFIDGVGWKHRELARLADKYGLKSANYDFSNLDKNAAFDRLKEFLNEGPVIASVHYTFNPKNPIPHLAVITGIDGETIYYNDPAETAGRKTIPLKDFLRAWKKRFIVARL